MVVSISVARAHMHARGVFFKVMLESSSCISVLSLIVYLCEISDPNMEWRGKSGPFVVPHLTPYCSGCLTCDAS
jgi:hypothetical protein